MQISDLHSKMCLEQIVSLLSFYWSFPERNYQEILQHSFRLDENYSSHYLTNKNVCIIIRRPVNVSPLLSPESLQIRIFNMDTANNDGGLDLQIVALKGASVLLIIGEPFTEEHRKLILLEVTKGICLLASMFIINPVGNNCMRARCTRNVHFPKGNFNRIVTLLNYVWLMSLFIKVQYGFVTHLVGN